MGPVSLPRWMHKGYAYVRGFFWIPCPLCGERFGGHEWKDRPSLYGGQKKSSTIRITDQALLTRDNCAICPGCTVAGLGGRSYPEGDLNVDFIELDITGIGWVR